MPDPDCLRQVPVAVVPGSLYDRHGTDIKGNACQVGPFAFVGVAVYPRTGQQLVVLRGPSGRLVLASLSEFAGWFRPGEEVAGVAEAAAR